MFIVFCVILGKTKLFCVYYLVKYFSYCVRHFRKKMGQIRKFLSKQIHIHPSYFFSFLPFYHIFLENYFLLFLRRIFFIWKFWKKVYLFYYFFKNVPQIFQKTTYDFLLLFFDLIFTKISAKKYPFLSYSKNLIITCFKKLFSRPFFPNLEISRGVNINKNQYFRKKVLLGPNN